MCMGAMCCLSGRGRRSGLRFRLPGGGESEVVGWVYWLRGLWVACQMGWKWGCLVRDFVMAYTVLFSAFFGGSSVFNVGAVTAGTGNELGTGMWCSPTGTAPDETAGMKECVLCHTRKVHLCPKGNVHAHYSSLHDLISANRKQTEGKLKRPSSESRTNSSPCLPEKRTESKP